MQGGWPVRVFGLLDWRNTPTSTAGIGRSPAQRLMGRRCRTLLPVAANLLKPRYDTEADTQALVGWSSGNSTITTGLPSH